MDKNKQCRNLFIVVWESVTMFSRKNFLALKNHGRNSSIISFRMKKLALLVYPTAFLLILLFSFSSGHAEILGINTGESAKNTDPSILSNHDSDGDGLSDDLERTLGTEVHNKSGDKDNDGLYDFEEYLDLYGTPNDTTDTPKYNYNNSRTYGKVLDIHHYFKLSNEDGIFVRDVENYTLSQPGFTGVVLWNVTFGAQNAGGTFSGKTQYVNNALRDVIFSGKYAGGGSLQARVHYFNNTFDNVHFQGHYTGGNERTSVIYNDNTFHNVRFTGDYAGGSRIGDVLYTHNTFHDVTISGNYAGGSEFGEVVYENNTFINARYNKQVFGSYIPAKIDSGLSGTGLTNYTGNVFDSVQYTQLSKPRADLNITLANNKILTDSYDSDGDGLGDVFEFLNGLEPQDNDSDNDRLNDGWEEKYRGAAGVHPLYRTLYPLSYDQDGDGLGLREEEKLGSNPNDPDTDRDGLLDEEELDLGLNASNPDTDGDGLNDSYEVDLGLNASNPDTDGDTLNDGWEVKYNGSSGVNVTGVATDAELISDQDDDGLTLKEEEVLGSNPNENDTDKDGLLDKDEIDLGLNPDNPDTDGDTLNDSYEVNKLGTNASNIDTDGDTLNDSYELFLNLNASNIDSDNDGLNDGWEVKYHDSSGVNSTDTANDTELGFDQDGDGLNLTEEEIEGTDPGDNDTDGDGLNDSYEVDLGLNPRDSDTDGDTLNDGWEFTYRTADNVDPFHSPGDDSVLRSDQDRDGLTLKEEEKLGTNPNNNDGDGDGLLDSWESQYIEAAGVDPTVAANTTELSSDEDKDGLNLSEEEAINTDPNNSDTDGDGLSDEWEFRHRAAAGVDPIARANDTELSSDEDMDGLTLLEEEVINIDPSNSDTDRDGLSDGWEYRYRAAAGVDPTARANDTELSSDEDMDGLTLLEEEEVNADPSNSDTDGDGLPDGWEYRHRSAAGVDPIIAVTDAELSSDEDADGLTLSEEEAINTDPSNLDTDGDGLSDGWEFRYRSAAGVDPIIAATNAELVSDVDMDGYTLLEEAVLDTDPENSNALTASTPPTTTTTSGSVEEIGVEGILATPLIPLVTLVVAVIIGILIFGLIRRRSKHRRNRY